MDSKLQFNFGTRRIESRVMFFETLTEPVPATFESEPSAILTIKFL